ncbi:four helix bundle protein [Candidatus Shapirobacteria bacterium CG09_land_8_20_14_0_10_47_13]|uniref:Four helix bundle protein n=1 Tax=Candidatus Shapirobacteria bacterium CG09_land_8_20_14_0_10_47_13 TaxID=1974481 RepID=A0A2H0WNI3_9BACT|nr:MAG: four helix bundle protein [Candidatus Shapirobacteria bacterium CG09_land_8_20_14_0_10_47_13]
MTSVKRFKDLTCWQEGKRLVNLIYGLTRQKTFSDFSLKDQIQRAAVSVISNIAEGFERGTREELIYFLFIAKGSCGEARTQLYIALDQKFISPQDFQQASVLAKRVSAMIYYLIQSLKVSGYKGLKYKSAKKEESWEEFMRKYAPDTLQKLKPS